MCESALHFLDYQTLFYANIFLSKILVQEIFNKPANFFPRIQVRYGNVWGTQFGSGPGWPSMYVQLGDDEFITHTLVRQGSLVDDVQITTCYRTYPRVGSNGGRPYYNSGSALRYIGSGNAMNTKRIGGSNYVVAAGLRMYFIC